MSNVIQGMVALKTTIEGAWFVVGRREAQYVSEWLFRQCTWQNIYPSYDTSRWPVDKVVWPDSEATLMDQPRRGWWATITYNLYPD